MFDKIKEQLNEIFGDQVLKSLKFKNDEKFVVKMMTGDKYNCQMLEDNHIEVDRGDHIVIYKNGKKHYDFGPAVKFKNDKKDSKSEWFLDGELITDENQHVTRIWLNKHNGWFKWVNKRDEFHRPETGPFARDDHHLVDFDHPSDPAQIGLAGKWWWQNNTNQRNPDVLAGGGPCQDNSNGSKEYNTGGVFHNPFGPAWEFESEKEWYINGELIKDENQKVTRHIKKINDSMEIKWLNINNSYHRPERGPFSGYNSETGETECCYSYGNQQFWYQNGMFHRNPAEGPALINNYGSKYYYNDGLHNPFGPAVIEKDGTPKWYLNGIEVTIPGRQVTRIMFDKEKGYYRWIDREGRIHRPMGGLFSKDDGTSDDKDPDPALVNENGKYWYDQGKIVRFEANKISNKIETIFPENVLNVSKESDQINNSNNLENSNNSYKCYCKKIDIDDTNNIKVILSVENMEVHKKDKCCSKKNKMSEFLNFIDAGINSGL